MGPSKSIFSIGVTATDEIHARLEASKHQIVEAGYGFEMVIFPIDQFSSELEKMKKTLSSKHWDGFVVGFGIRGNSKNTEMLETLVNTASEILPGVKFGFPQSPEDLYPCVTRNFWGDRVGEGANP